jgi:two-component sensor histidine kinase/HAMP domain-containing protein
MKIRTRIHISSGLSILLTLLLFMTLFLSYRQIEDKLEVVMQDTLLLKKMISLTMMTSSFISEPHERSKQQWYIEYANIRKENRNPAISAEIDDELSFMKDLFTRLEAETLRSDRSRRATARNTGSDSSAVLADMIAGQLQMSSQKLMNRLLEVSAAENDRINAMRSRNYIFIFVFTMMILFIFSINAYSAMKGISDPLRRLVRGARNFDRDNDSFTIAPPEKKRGLDEIDELTLAFIDMTSSIRESIRDLQDEITTRVEAERNLQRSLQEKNVLLREIHHRVKNNMQLVSSLINLQAHYTNDPGYAALIEESHIRINSMAMVHEMLYQSDNVYMINLGTFIKRLSEYIERFIGGKGGDIKLKVDSGDIFIDINYAIPCALIMNELITNTHKHAFRRTPAEKKRSASGWRRMKTRSSGLSTGITARGFPRRSEPAKQRPWDFS